MEIYVATSFTIHGTRKVVVAGWSIILNDGKMWEEFVITETLQQCLSKQPFKTMLHIQLEIKLDPLTLSLVLSIQIPFSRIVLQI